MKLFDLHFLCMNWNCECFCFFFVFCWRFGLVSKVHIEHALLDIGERVDSKIVLGEIEGGQNYRISCDYFDSDRNNKANNC